MKTLKQQKVEALHDIALSLDCMLETTDRIADALEAFVNRGVAADPMTAAEAPDKIAGCHEMAGMTGVTTNKTGNQILASLTPELLADVAVAASSDERGK